MYSTLGESISSALVWNKDPLDIINENTDSIMRSKTRKTYIYNRYCRFLAWEEHIRIASIYEADLVPVCTRKALLAAIKALLLYYGIGCKDSRVDFTSVRFYKKASR